MQSNGASASSAASASSDEPTATISTSPSPPTSSTIDCRWASSSSTTSNRRTSRLMNDSIPPKTSSSASADAGFWRKAAAPAISAGCISSTPETMCTGMCRVAGCRLSRSSTVQPSSTGRVMSSTIASGRNSRASARPGVAAQRHDPLEAALPRDLELGAGEVGVVLDDQHDAVALLDRVAVVAHLARHQQREVEGVENRSSSMASSPFVALRNRGRRRRQPGGDRAQDVRAGLGRAGARRSGRAGRA